MSIFCVGKFQSDTIYSMILFHDQFTDSLYHCLHPVLVNCEISIDWMVSDAFHVIGENRRTAKTGDSRIYWTVISLNSFSEGIWWSWELIYKVHSLYNKRAI